jgi:hypothetical protein
MSKLALVYTFFLHATFAFGNYGNNSLNCFFLVYYSVFSSNAVCKTPRVLMLGYKG